MFLKGFVLMGRKNIFLEIEMYAFDIFLFI